MTSAGRWVIVKSSPERRDTGKAREKIDNRYGTGLQKSRAGAGVAKPRGNPPHRSP